MTTSTTSPIQICVKIKLPNHVNPKAQTPLTSTLGIHGDLVRSSMLTVYVD